MSPSPPHAADRPDTARDDAWITDLRVGLLDFFDAHARDLPWRRTSDPYAIWVSEIMLQQTRVETVVPYWQQWMARYPTPAALAAAPQEEVLKAWEGLGYYSRARNLHRAASLVREEHGGRLPDTEAGLRELPGVGVYTAGAVASIAFGIPAPAVDGNVRRVAARLLDWPEPTPAQLQKVVGAWVPGPAGSASRSTAGDDAPSTRRANPAGDFNQALMELGATICTPRNPGCYACPVGELCAAKAAGTVAKRPAPKKRAKVREEERRVEVRVRLGGAGGPRGRSAARPGGRPSHPGVRARDVSFLLRKRSGEGLLAGMYEFPSRILDEGADADEASGPGTQPADGAARPKAGMVQPDGRALEPVLHVFTHLRVTYRPVLWVEEDGEDGAPDGSGERPAAAESRARAYAGEPAPDWYPLREIRDLPLPVAQQKILALALEALEQPEL